MGKNFQFEPGSVLISDIRSEIDDDAVHRDNLLQMGWSRHQNVLFGTYKFRYPFVKKVVYDFKYDFLFLQCFKGSRSSESRMYVSRDAKILLDEQQLYDEKMCFFNDNHRFKGRSCNDCRLREHILLKFVVLPRGWALMFGMLSEYDVRSSVGISECGHEIKGRKYLCQCLYCNWFAVNVTEKKY